MKQQSDTYCSLETSQQIETKVKGSRFIATAFPVQDKESIQHRLATVREQYFDASHHCYAWRLGPDGLLFRSADDGEPSGSAGKPILFILQKHQISDAMVVVTRYFGGTKLGVGGLARAYSDAAEQVLTTAQTKTVYRTVPLRVLTSYEDSGYVRRVIDKFALSVGAEYGDLVTFEVRIPVSQVDEFTQTIESGTHQRAGVLSTTE